MSEAERKELARILNSYFDETGFVLLTYQFGDGGECQYISNTKRDDVVNLLEEHLEYLKQEQSQQQQQQQSLEKTTPVGRC